MMRLSIILVAILSVSAARPSETTKLIAAPYATLPKEVRTGVLNVIVNACLIDPAKARKQAKSARVFRTDLDGDGIDDYLMDQWDGPCVSTPAHYIFVWMGNRQGHFEQEDHAEAYLYRGHNGFSWVQTRCNKLNNDDFQIETYQNGKRRPSVCYSGNELSSVLHTRGLIDAIPR